MRYGFLALLALILGACSARDSSSTVTVAGEVVEGATARPVQGVQVTATFVNEPANPGEIVPSYPSVVTTTDDSGRFALDVPLSGVVDDPTNPTRIIPVTGLPVTLRFEHVIFKGTECDSTGPQRILWNIYAKVTTSRTFQLPDGGTLNIGTVFLEEFTEETEFRSGTPGGC